MNNLLTPQHTLIKKRITMADVASTAAAPALPVTMIAYASDGTGAGEEGTKKGGYEQVSLPVPTPEGLDILVRNEAISMNPADGKVMRTAQKGRIGGWDSVGVVAAVGPQSTRFKVGDRVWFSGALFRPGTNAQFTVVDERIVSAAPKTGTAAENAALPLVALTAFEGLVEKLGLSSPESIGKSILVLPGGGGVGSIVIQLAKRVFNMEVVATASRDETVAFCRDLGADHVINHRKPLKPQLEELGLSGVNYVFNAYDVTTANFDQFAEITLPLGGIVNLTPPDKGTELALGKLFYTRVSYHFELMFQRGLSGDPEERSHQGKILKRVAFLVDKGIIKSTKQREVKLTKETLEETLALQESGKAVGKTVLLW